MTRQFPNLPPHVIAQLRARGLEPEEVYASLMADILQVRGIPPILADKLVKPYGQPARHNWPRFHTAPENRWAERIKAGRLRPIPLAVVIP